MYDELLFTVEGAKAAKVDRVTMSERELHERAHLQEWILANPEVIGPHTKVIVSEYDRWQDAAGAPVADRLDILALDLITGRLVVVELKRDAAPAMIHMQAINYAAMVSRLSMDDVAEIHAAWLTKTGTPTDREAALTVLSQTVIPTEEGFSNPRIVLIASDFPAQVTTSVVWLNERQVDITLIRYRVYDLGDRTAVSFTRLYPVPSVEDFTTRRRVDAAAAEPIDAGPPWDEESLRLLAAQANPATLALLDLCAAQVPTQVGVRDIAAVADITVGAVRGQLAGLTMKLRNGSFGLQQQVWPATVNWLAGGVASYQMEPTVAQMWRGVRGDELATHPGASAGASNPTGA